MNLTKREAYDIALDMWGEISETGGFFFVYYTSVIK